MYQSFNIRFTSNSITNNRVVDLDSGKTVIQPINTDGNFSMGLWSGMGFKLKKLDTRINLGPNFRYSRTADVFNNVTNYSKILAIGTNMNVSKEKEKKYEVNLEADISYNNSKNSLSNSSSNYFTFELDASAKVFIQKTLSVKAEYELYTQQKTRQLNTGLTTHLLNGRIEKTFKKDEFTAYFLVRDILNQNIGVNRFFDSNRFTELQNDRLKRYWMIGFTWNFKNAGAKAK
jgi:hypothetical protein